MTDHSLQNKQGIVTQAVAFIDPVLYEVFAGYGAVVIAGMESLQRSVRLFAGQVFPVCGGWVPR